MEKYAVRYDYKRISIGTDNFLNIYTEHTKTTNVIKRFLKKQRLFSFLK